MRDFATLFRGRTDAHGQYYALTGGKTQRGKRTSKAESVREEVTPAMYAMHLTGKGKRLGIIPVCSDGKVWWICLDIDFYDIGDYHKKLAARIKELRLPLIQTVSKSGGAHLWVFFEEAVQAQKAQKIAFSILEQLELPELLGTTQEEIGAHIDVFPKNFDATDIGVWMNLPYFGGVCHCVGETGVDDLSLEDFVDYANQRITAESTLNWKAKEPSKSNRSPLPPCIDFMMKNPVGEGHRDYALTHAAIVMKRAEGDTWKEKTFEFNESCMDPPMRRDEVAKIVRSVASKDYQYMCEKVKQLYCDKVECKKRKFGVGQDPVDITIEQIEKIDGEKPTYIVKIQGRRIVCSADELTEYARFRKKAFSILDRFLPQCKQGEWEEIVDEQMARMEVTEVLDLTMQDRVIKEFKLWTGQGIVQSSLEEALEARQAFFNGKQIIFRGDDFMTIVDRKLKCDRDKTFIYMRQWGVIQVEISKRLYWAYTVDEGDVWFEQNRAEKK